MDINNTNKASVLIVDDNPINLDLLYVYFDQASFEVLIAEDGESAIEQVQYAKPDIILLDVMMPNLDGFETCRRLKNNSETKDIPIIFMTALSDTADKIRGFEAGAVDYITKPLQHDEVLARVTTHLTIERLKKDLQEQNIQLQQEISQRKRVEKELLARNEELDAFAGTVAHDLKTPLQLIIGRAELIETDDQLAEKYRQDLGKLSHAAKQMNRTIEALLLFARIRDTDISLMPVDTKLIIERSLDRITHMITEYQAEFDLPASWPVGLGYEPWIEEIWVNYLSNAIKYGGRPPQIELGAKLEMDGFVQFWIRDNGKGFSSEEQAKLFTEFTQLNNIKSEGYGLGLSIVQRIVQKLGGQVGVESQIGQGSTFSFSLKAATDKP